MTQASAPPGASFLATRKGQLTLVFLLVVALLDFMGIAIVNVALPSIRARPALLPAKPAMGRSAATWSPTEASCCSAGGWPTCSGDA